MTDMTAVIQPKSDQINADDLIAGPITIRITDVKVSPGQEQPVSISFEGEKKVFRPCKSMARVMVAAWGPDAKAYVGRSLTLYRDPKVKWGGMEVGGIRISHMSHIDRDMTMMLTESKANRKPFRVQVMKDAPKPKEPEGMTSETASALAVAAAKLGTDHFRKWFNTDEGKAARAAGGLDMAELKRLAEAADADPFGLPPLTADDLARAEAEALAEIERQHSEADQ